MSYFEQYIYDKVKKQIFSWEKNIVDDVYVLSFYIDCEADNMRKPRLIFGYNTNSNYIANIPNASDKDEDKWNYAFWLQNEEIVIGDNYKGTDSKEKFIRDQWVNQSQWYYTDKDEEEDFSKTLELGERILQDFYETVQKVVTRLHTEQVIRTLFHKDIPLIVHELEYYDKFIYQNQNINPEESIKEFVKWIESM